MTEPLQPTRQHERLLVNREFESIEEFITEYVSNLSATGAFIRTDDPLPVGTKVDLKFTVIADDFESIEGVGEVVRVVPPGQREPPGMAVVFTELTKYSAQLILQLLTRGRKR
ncbi:MAG: PilZ domain-containing protein [Pseudomonadota bacterium]